MQSLQLPLTISILPQAPNGLMSYFLPFLFMTSLKETPVLNSFLSPKFCFRFCHTSRNAFLSLSQSHPWFRAYFKFLFFLKAFSSTPLYITLFSPMTILPVHSNARFITKSHCCSKACTTFYCSVVLSEVDFPNENRRVEELTPLSVSSIPLKLSILYIISIVSICQSQQITNENRLYGTGNSAHCSPET